MSNSASASKMRLHKKILAEVDARRGGAPFIIGINGIDGSGKTTFATELSRFLLDQGRSVQVVHVDDFHNSRETRYGGDDEAQNYYYRSIDFNRLTSALLEPIVIHRELDVDLVLLDLDADQYTLRKSYVVNRDTIVIVEGVFILRRELVRYLDLKIFLDITFAESVKRALVRDRQTSPQSIEQRYSEKYHAGQKLYFGLDDPKSAADLIVNNEDYSNPFEVR